MKKTWTRFSINMKSGSPVTNFGKSVNDRIEACKCKKEAEIVFQDNVDYVNDVNCCSLLRKNLNLEEKILDEVLPRFNDREVANLFFCQAKTNGKLGRKSFENIKTRESFAENLISLDLTNFFWASSKMSFRDEILFSKIIKSKKEEIKKLPPKSMGLFFWSLAKLEFRTKLDFDSLTEKFFKNPDSQSIANLLFGYEKIGISSRNFEKNLMKVLKDSNFHNFQTHEVSSVILSLAKIGILDSQLFQVALKVVDVKNFQSVINLIWSLAKSKIQYDEDLLNSVLLKLNFNSAKPLEISILLYSLGRLNLFHEPSFLKVVSLLEKQNLDFSSQSTMNLFWAFASLQVEDELVFQKLKVSVLKNESLYTNSQISNLAWSFSKLRFFDSEVLDCIFREMMRVIETSKISHKTSRDFGMINFAAAIFAIEDSRFLEVVKKMEKKFESKIEKLVEDRFFSSQTFTTSYFFNQKFGEKLFPSFDAILKRNFLESEYFLKPSSSHAHLSVCRFLRDFGVNYQSEAKLESLRSADVKIDKKIIEINGGNHYILNFRKNKKRLNGPTILRNEIFRLDGYEVFDLDASEVIHHLNTSDLSEYLRKNLRLEFPKGRRTEKSTIPFDYLRRHVKSKEEMFRFFAIREMNAADFSTSLCFFLKNFDVKLEEISELLKENEYQAKNLDRRGAVNCLFHLTKLPNFEETQFFNLVTKRLMEEFEEDEKEFLTSKKTRIPSVEFANSIFSLAKTGRTEELSRLLNYLKKLDSRNYLNSLDKRQILSTLAEKDLLDQNFVKDWLDDFTSSQFHGFRQHNLVRLLWVLTKLKNFDTKILISLNDEILKDLPYFDFKNSVQLLHSTSQLVSEHEFFKETFDKALEIVMNEKHWKSIDLTQIVTSLANINFSPVPVNFFLNKAEKTKLSFHETCQIFFSLSRLESNSSSFFRLFPRGIENEFFVEKNFVDILTLARGMTQSRSFLKKVFEFLFRPPKNLDVSYFCSSLHSLARSPISIDEEEFFSLCETVKTREKEMNELQKLISLWSLTILLDERDPPPFFSQLYEKVHVLGIDPNSCQMLLQIYTGLFCAKKQVFLNEKWVDVCRLRKSEQHRQCLASGSLHHEVLTYIQNWESEVEIFPGFEVDLLLDKNVIEILGETHFFLNLETGKVLLSSPTRWRLKIIEKLGYSVKTLNFHDWRVRTSSEREDYLRKLTF